MCAPSSILSRSPWFPRYLPLYIATIASARGGTRSFATTARASFTITPRLALQTFAQLFLASGHYDDFRSFVTAGGGPGSQNVRLAALTPSAPPVSNPDFVDVSLNLNVVLRWEYSLGSVLYFVFNRSQTPATPLLLDQPAALSFTPLGRAPARCRYAAREVAALRESLS